LWFSSVLPGRCWDRPWPMWAGSCVALCSMPSGTFTQQLCCMSLYIQYSLSSHHSVLYSLSCCQHYCEPGCVFVMVVHVWHTCNQWLLLLI
jgi:hypothetical protein